MTSCCCRLPTFLCWKQVYSLSHKNLNEIQFTNVIDLGKLLYLSLRDCDFRHNLWTDRLKLPDYQKKMPCTRSLTTFDFVVKFLEHLGFLFYLKCTKQIEGQTTGIMWSKPPYFSTVGGNTVALNSLLQICHINLDRGVWRCVLKECGGVCKGVWWCVCKTSSR